MILDMQTITLESIMNISLLFLHFPAFLALSKRVYVCFVFQFYLFPSVLQGVCFCSMVWLIISADEISNMDNLDSLRIFRSLLMMIVQM